MRRQITEGFSIIEVMVAVGIIGILAMLGGPTVFKAFKRAEAMATGNDLRVFSQAIEFYSGTTGSYPESMAYTAMPDEIGDYLPGIWKDGSYAWLYIKNTHFVYLYVDLPELSTLQSVTIDAAVDDGNLATGSLRKTPSGLIYIFRSS